MRQLDRRRFLTLTGLGAGVVSAGTHRARANDPLRPGEAQPKIGLSCCAYSFRDLLTGDAPPMDLFSFVDCAAEYGLDGVELTSYYFPSDFGPGYLRDLKRHCRLRGGAISGGAVGNNFCGPPDEKEDEIRDVIEWLGHYRSLGAPLMRVFAGDAPKGHTPEEAREWVAQCLERCIPAAARAGVVMALENHGGVTSDAEGVLWILDRVASPWVAANLDLGNFPPDDPYADLAAVAPRAVNAHAKEYLYAAGEEKGAPDWVRILTILRDAGFNGYVSIEYEGDAPPREGVPDLIASIRAAMREVGA